MLRNRFDRALRPREVQPAQNRFVLEWVYLYPEEQAEFSKKNFVLAVRRLLASARALASDCSSASIAEPLHEAAEDHATIRNVLEKSQISEERGPEDTEEGYCKRQEAEAQLSIRSLVFS